MNRRLSMILLPLAAGALAACSSVSNDSIATVEGVDLTQDDFEELLAVIPSTASIQGEAPLPGDPDNIQDVRQTITVWVQGQAIGGAMDRNDVEAPPEIIDQATEGLAQQLPGFADLSDTNRELILDLVTGPDALAQDPPPASQEVLDAYAEGPEVSGLICVSHILVDDVATATDIKTRLDDGADFAELAAAESTDPGSGQAGGDLGCFDIETFGTTFIPEFVAGALEAEMGVPTDPVESQFGAHVILVRTAEESAEALGALAFDVQNVIDDADISIASRYGTYDGAAGVVPLG